MTENIQHRDSVETTFIIPAEESDEQKKIITILVNDMCSTAPESIPKEIAEKFKLCHFPTYEAMAKFNLTLFAKICFFNNNNIRKQWGAELLRELIINWDEHDQISTKRNMFKRSIDDAAERILHNQQNYNTALALSFASFLGHLFRAKVLEQKTVTIIMNKLFDKNKRDKITFACIFINACGNLSDELCIKYSQEFKLLRPDARPEINKLLTMTVNNLDASVVKNALHMLCTAHAMCIKNDLNFKRMYMGPIIADQNRRNDIARAAVEDTGKPVYPPHENVITIADIIKTQNDFLWELNKEILENSSYSQATVV